MRQLTESEQKQWRLLQLITLAIGVVVPLIYLVIPLTIKVPLRTAPPANLFFYVLLTLGAIQPALAFLVNHFQVNMYRKSSQTEPSKLYLSIIILRLPLVSAIFTYGMIIYFMFGDFNRTLFYFYPLGALWLLACWPRKAKYEAFIEEMGTNIHRA